MKQLKTACIVAACIVLHFACTSKPQVKPESAHPTDSQKSSEAFLKLFKDINPKGLHLYSSYLDTKRQPEKADLEAVRLDVTKYKFTCDSLLFAQPDKYKNGWNRLYALAKFQINKRYTALLVRQDDSAHHETSIELMLWDKKYNALHKGLALADSYNKAGWQLNKESWITRYRYRSELEIVSRQKRHPITRDADNANTNDSLLLNRWAYTKFVSCSLPKKELTHYQWHNKS